jgi:hypothetical protein
MRIWMIWKIRVFYKRTDFVNDACEKERGKKVQVFKMSL